MANPDFGMSTPLPVVAGRPRAGAQVAAIWFMFAAFAAALVWAYFARLDEVTSARGQVVPILQEQSVESLEGGILRELLVRTDQIVEAGEVLARLDPTGATARVDEIEAKLLAQRARVARLTAEVSDSPLVFPETLSAHTELVRSETSLFEARRDSRTNSLSLIDQSRTLLQEELEVTEQLRQRGASSRMDVARLKREIIDLNLSEDEIRHEYYVLAREDLSQARADVEALEAELRGLQDRLNRLTLRSPVRGIVKSIEVSTEGGVVPPDGTLMTIVPLDDQLLIEARVEPRDIAFIRPGLRAVVKISAYDSTIYGNLEGSVRSVSADSIRDKVDPETLYYRVYVQSDTFELRNDAGRTFPITPGMVTTVDIHTGAKTVMQYLIKPFNRAAEAMRER